MVIGNRCSSPSSREIAKSASKGCIGTKRCSVAAGPVARCVTSLSIIVASPAEKFHFSKPGLGFANRAVRSRPVHQLLFLKRLILPSLSARDLRPAFRFLPASSRLASTLCTNHSVCSRTGDFCVRRILHHQLLDQRSIYMAKNEPCAGFDAHPSCLVL